MHDPFDDPRYEVVLQAHRLALATGTRPCLDQNAGYARLVLDGSAVVAVLWL